MKALVNSIFAHEGIGPVKNFASEFADGCKSPSPDELVLFQTLYNILFQEKVDCRLVRSNSVQERKLNWNRINASICFNRLQQAFYIVEPTMLELAQGKRSKAIMRLLGALLQCYQGIHGDVEIDSEGVKDIADVIECQSKEPMLGHSKTN